MLRVTKLTSRARAWSDRVLLTPVLRGLARPFRLLWAAVVFIAALIWRWLLRPVWRFLLRPVWQWAIRPVLWLPLRWTGQQIWRFLLRPVWQWAIRPVLWLPLRWTGQQIWRWLLRPIWRFLLLPIWSLLRWAGAVVLASPWILARTLPNRGWLTSLVVLALTAAVVLVPGAVNKKTRGRTSQVAASSAVQRLGTDRPEMSVSLAPFAGWSLAPFDEGHRELVLRQNEAELRVSRTDAGELTAEGYLRWYATVKLGVRDPGRLYPQRVTVKDANGKPVPVLEIEQDYHVIDQRNPDLSRYSRVLLYNYGTAILLIVFSKSRRETSLPLEQLRLLKDSVRITP
ncbi:hypothetical protein [Segniliparus rugosus]|uniref:Uncharacterized protein n=1 Tax=Segniliparus rugosus (strain ATCC BAA-974 / DSM 45345 / CCUG 50838 / CIP 108380 / JCM 13579 / CDC 945) TaxID=679197 RepID=E5XSW6_SEGRC|nr:hypothetical protein [Segniliparus rugosus]EFV12559.1 hypothetical protein HMPREF9336_02588 [Segniliparus rugosus ATCC BAA-974]